MSTVINNIKFSHYKFTTEQCYELPVFSTKREMSGQVHNIICADGITSEEGFKLMMLLKKRVDGIVNNLDRSDFSYEIIYTYCDMFGFSPVMLCSGQLWDFILNEVNLG